MRWFLRSDANAVVENAKRRLRKVRQLITRGVLVHLDTKRFGSAGPDQTEGDLSMSQAMLDRPPVATTVPTVKLLINGEMVESQIERMARRGESGDPSGAGSSAVCHA